MGNYFQPEIERASRDQIRAWQDERLVKQVRHVYENVPYYRNLMDKKGVAPEDIRYRRDASLIGGMTVRIGDQVLDGSVRTRLRSLKE